MTEYIHWAKKEFDLDRRYFYNPIESRRFFKPFGLWFEVDGDWQRWCEAENFRKDEMNVCYQLEFEPFDVLFLKNELDIDRFTHQYERGDLERNFHMDIDWPQVAEEYSGIVIAPYCWQRRMANHTMWYYGWDCASGCIWDLSIITRFERIERPALSPEERES